jgi:hypothetical protein
MAEFEIYKREALANLKFCLFPPSRRNREAYPKGKGARGKCPEGVWARMDLPNAFNHEKLVMG